VRRAGRPVEGGQSAAATAKVLAIWEQTRHNWLHRASRNQSLFLLLVECRLVFEKRSFGDMKVVTWCRGEQVARIMSMN
jgi:hypothetical protein